MVVAAEEECELGRAAPRDFLGSCQRRFSEEGLDARDFFSKNKMTPKQFFWQTKSWMCHDFFLFRGLFHALVGFGGLSWLEDMGGAFSEGSPQKGPFQRDAVAHLGWSNILRQTHLGYFDVEGPWFKGKPKGQSPVLGSND